MPTNFAAYKRKKERLAKASNMCPCCDCPKSECDCPADCQGCSCHGGNTKKMKTNKSFREFSRLYED